MNPSDQPVLPLAGDAWPQTDVTALAASAKARLAATIESHRRACESHARALIAARSEARREADERIAAVRAQSAAQAEALRSAARRAVESVAAERDSAERAHRESYERLAAELKQARARLSEATLEIEVLKKGKAALEQNQRRLHLAFVSLVKSIDEACGAGIGVDRRIEAILLSSEVGGSLGECADMSTRSSKEFLSLAGQGQADGLQTENSHERD